MWSNILEAFSRIEKKRCVGKDEKKKKKTRKKEKKSVRRERAAHLMGWRQRTRIKENKIQRYMKKFLDVCRLKSLFLSLAKRRKKKRNTSKQKTLKSAGKRFFFKKTSNQWRLELPTYRSKKRIFVENDKNHPVRRVKWECTNKVTRRWKWIFQRCRYLWVIWKSYLRERGRDAVRSSKTLWDHKKKRIKKVVRPVRPCNSVTTIRLPLIQMTQQIVQWNCLFFFLKKCWKSVVATLCKLHCP